MMKTQASLYCRGYMQEEKMKGGKRRGEEKKRIRNKNPRRGEMSVASSCISGGSALDSGPWMRYRGACSRAMLVGLVGRA